MTFISRRDLLKAAAIVPIARGFQSGVRTMVTTADQKSLEAKTLKANHKSAYEYDFTKDAERQP